MNSNLNRRPGRAGTYAAMSVVLLVGASGCRSHPRAVTSVAAQSAAAPQSDALTSLNAAFRQAYAEAKRRTLAATGPLIIVKGDTATLVRDGRRTEGPINAPVYHSLKTVAHVPLAVYAALTPGDGPVDAERLKTLEGLRRLIPPARSSLAGLGFSAPVLARVDRIVADSLAFLDDVIARREFTRGRLDAFTRRVAPLLMANVADATRAELDALHAQVSSWRREMSPAEWQRLHVVIVGPHMPRDGEVATQYFLRLLRERSEGRRIVYAESLWDEPRALDLLATHVLDGGVGESFFGEFMRMHRDLLTDAGREHIARLLPE